MSAAMAVVVPSTYEGFGFPVLEAMARRTAVVAVNRAALPEISGEAAVLVEPEGAAIAAGLVAILDDEARRVGLARAGFEHAKPFTWDRSAAAHAAVFRQALARSQT
jgi:glycosyltransferase involved in cell wall biosynthesis